MKKKLNRRTVLRGAGGISIGLPFLGAMLKPNTSHAQGVGPYFITYFTPNNTRNDGTNELWTPGGTGNVLGTGGRTLTPTLAALTPHIEDISIIDGLRNEAAAKAYKTEKIEQHTGSSSTVLVNRSPIRGGVIATSGNGSPIYASSGSGASIDRYIADNIAATPRKTINLNGISATMGVPAGQTAQQYYYHGYFTDRSAISRRGPGSENIEKAIFSPASAFDILVSNSSETSTATAEISRLHALRKSVLDTVLEDYKTLCLDLGHEDKCILDGHLTALNEVETRYLLPPSTLTCGTSGISYTSHDAFLALGAGDKKQFAPFAHAEITALALSCGLTRVAVIQLGGESGDAGDYEFLGKDNDAFKTKMGQHLISHLVGGADVGERLAAILSYRASIYAHLIDALKAKNIFDQSCVLWCTGSRGNAHDLHNLPTMIAGSANGYFKTGQYLNLNTAPPVDPNNPEADSDAIGPGRGNRQWGGLLTSICNAMGVSIPHFGDPEFTGTGAITELKA